ncbi:MAG: SPOR domain-containing protein, partial [Sphingopyxis sp.]|nr:SPOR domain-containing protein [Sphingopyxis sp.]
VRVRRTNPPMAERAQLRSGNPVPERIATPDSLLSILRNKLKALPAPKAAMAAEPAAPIASGTAKPGDDRFVIEGESAKKPEAKPAPKPAAATKPAPAKPAPATKPAATAGSYAVQVGAFSSEANANTAAKSVGGSVSKAGNLWRVRMGPFSSDADAKAALGKAKAKGFRDATVVRDR